MTTDDVARHYSRGDLLSRLTAALTADGADPGHPTLEALAPYDQFHGRGMEATLDIAALMPARASDHVLDIGSGIGGPARFVASRFGCRVTGIDLTEEFCDVARHLTRLLRLEDKVTFDNGDALHMPYGDAAFDGAYSLNVSMNIADKAAFYREIHRVLAPDGWLVLSEIAQGDGVEPEYPMPWASSPRTSFLSAPEAVRQGLRDAGFDIVHFESTRDAALAFGARARALVERGEKPPLRGVTLVHPDSGTQEIANSARALAEGRIVPIELLARKRRPA